MARRHPRVKTSHGYTVVTGHSPSGRVRPVTFTNPAAYQALTKAGVNRSRAKALASTGFVQNGGVEKLSRRNF